MGIRAWVAFAAMALWTVVPVAADPFEAPSGVSEPWREVEAFYRSALARHHIQGSSLLVVRSGKVANRAVDGLQDRDTGKPVTEDTIFHC